MDELRDTFVRYLRPHWRRLHVVAGRYSGGGDDVRDLVQETLLRAWRAFSPTEERSYSRAWLYVILRNVAAEWRRAAQRRVRLVGTEASELTELAPADLSEPFAPLPAMDEERFREFLDGQIAAALDGVEEPFREVIVLSVAGGLTYREIAEVLDCPVGTVMSRMGRARRALRERLCDFARVRGLGSEKRR